jgi:flagellar hook-associated protein 1 FlgK
VSFAGLGIAVSGLNAAQRQLEVAAHNIANVNTEGYTRQRVELATARPVPGAHGRRGDGMRGMGVTVADVIRIRDTLADAAYRNEKANQASWSAKASVLARAEQVLGPFDAGTPQALSRFYAAWDQLSLYPQDPAARDGVLDAGRLLASQFQAAARELTNLGKEAAAQASERAEEANRLAAEVAKLNVAIVDVLAGKQAPNDLLDARDRLVDRLAALTGATALENDDGSLTVFVGTQALVRGDGADRLVVQTSPTLGVTFASNGQAAAVGGQLGGLLEVANVTLPALRADLDAVAVGLRDTVNAAHAAGYDLDGNPGMAFFTGTGAADLAVNPAVGMRQVAASAGGQPTDGNNAVAVAATRTTPAVGGSTVTEALNAFAGRLGALAAAARSSADASGAVVEGIRRERAEVGSVSLDEELANMVRFQRSYEAAARVITAIDEMLDRLVNNTGLVGR